MHTQTGCTRPFLGGRRKGWNEPNGGVEYDIIFKSYAVMILTSIVNLVCQTPAVKGQD